MDKIKITIDGKQVECVRDQCVLEVALNAGIYIPSLCWHPEVKNSGGSCRVCLVEAHQEGRSRLVTACNFPVREGLEIITDSELVKRIRRQVLENMLTRKPDDKIIHEIAAKLEIKNLRVFENDQDDTWDACLACGLCVHVCEEIVGVCAISMLDRGFQKRPGTPYDKPSADCIGCGACAYVCPTQSIVMEDTGDIRKIWGREFKMICCSYCGKPYIPEAQVEWIVNKTGKERSYFDTCQDHRGM